MKGNRWWSWWVQWLVVKPACRENVFPTQPNPMMQFVPKGVLPAAGGEVKRYAEKNNRCNLGATEKKKSVTKEKWG